MTRKFNSLQDKVLCLSSEEKKKKKVRFDLEYNFPGGSDGKASVYNVGDPGSISGHEDLLEKEMATHSSILAWKIPWEEHGGLQSMGSQRVDRTERLHFHFLP